MGGFANPVLGKGPLASITPAGCLGQATGPLCPSTSSSVKRDFRILPGEYQEPLVLTRTSSTTPLTFNCKMRCSHCCLSAEVVRYLG